MDKLLQKLAEAILAGGPSAIIAILIGVVGFLIWERRRLMKLLEQKDAKIELIINDYHKGNISLVEALNSLKMVMVEIKSRL